MILPYNSGGITMASINNYLGDVPLSVFDSLTEQIEERNHPHFFPLHQGKTTFPPCANLSEWELGNFELEAHQHASPTGALSLRKAILTKMNNKYSKDLNEKVLTITCGATHAIGIALRTVLRPGDEVLLLSPQWLFAYGLVRAANGIPVEVPVFFELSKDARFDFVSMLQSRISPKTKAIYFNSPNNPTGVSLTRGQLEDLAQFAEKYNLWIIADNAYENYDYTLQGYLDIAQLDTAIDRTFAIYTFSKTYAMPGYRVGYVIAPELMADQIRKISLYSIYSVSTASQFGALQALNVETSILAKYHLWAMQARDIVVNELHIPYTYPQGGLYTLLNLSEWAIGDTNDFIRQCIENGVSLAPGIAFGNEFDNYARLCFTSVNHEDLHIAIKRLNDIYENW